MQARGRVRWLAGFALFGVAWFALVATTLQFVREGELDWVDAPLSLYLAGRDGPWLAGAYYVLGAGLLALAVGLRAGIARQARYTLSPWLFALGGIALMVTAHWHGSGPGHREAAINDAIHGIAASTSFVLIGFAMMLASFGVRRDVHWRACAGWLLALAVLAFALLWVQVLDRQLPRGESQKAVIALYAAWLALAAWRLLRTNGERPLPAE